ncbi:hypothetical protein [Methanobacterium sp.]|uniref:hypothetical protein n=1 Tax=Methanobacterium sp. TaxID=2164 RepID=UPI0031589A1F
MFTERSWRKMFTKSLKPFGFGALKIFDFQGHETRGFDGTNRRFVSYDFQTSKTSGF